MRVGSPQAVTAGFPSQGGASGRPGQDSRRSTATHPTRSSTRGFGGWRP